jgi:hypothetical protein
VGPWVGQRVGQRVGEIDECHHPKVLAKKRDFYLRNVAKNGKHFGKHFSIFLNVH